MDIEFKGANCIVITTKKATVVVDGKLSSVGLKDVMPKGAISLATQADFMLEPEDGLMIDRPGEYEVSNVSVKGISTKRMIDYDDVARGTLYRVRAGGVTIAIVGHTATPLSEEQLEAIGVVDVAVIPVGGNGYTSDGHQAVGLVRQLDPKVVIPTHFADKSVHYEVPQMELEPFVKELSAPAHEKATKWKVKNGVLPDVVTLLELERAA